MTPIRSHSRFFRKGCESTPLPAIPFWFGQPARIRLAAREHSSASAGCAPPINGCRQELGRCGTSGAVNREPEDRRRRFFHSARLQRAERGVRHAEGDIGGRLREKWSETEVKLLLETAELKEEHPEAITWAEFAERCRRTVKAVYNKLDKHRRRIWSASELAALHRVLENCQQVGKAVNWSSVADSVGRTERSCCTKAMQLGLFACSSMTKWTPAEDKILVTAVDKMLERDLMISWPDVVKHLPGRSGNAAMIRLHRLHPAKRCWFPSYTSNEAYKNAVKLARSGERLTAVICSMPGCPMSIGNAMDLIRTVDKGHRKTYVEEFHVWHKSKWTPEQRAELVRLRTTNPYMHWCKIGIMLGRTPLSCQKKFSRLRKIEYCGPFNVECASRPHRRSCAFRKWSPLEAKLLRGASGVFRKEDWDEIMEVIPGRTLPALKAKRRELEAGPSEA